MILKKIFHSNKPPEASSPVFDDDLGLEDGVFPEYDQITDQINELAKKNILPSFDCDIPFLTKEHKLRALKNWYGRYIGSRSHNFYKANYLEYRVNKGKISSVNGDFSENIVKHVRHFFIEEDLFHDLVSTPGHVNDSERITSFALATACPLTTELQQLCSPNSDELQPCLETIYPIFSRLHEIYCGNSPKNYDDDELTEITVSNELELAYRINRPDIFSSLIPKLMKFIKSKESLLIDFREKEKSSQHFYPAFPNGIYEVFKILDIAFLEKVARSDEFIQSCYPPSPNKIDEYDPLLPSETMFYLLFVNMSLNTSPARITSFSFLWEDPKHEDLIPIISRIASRRGAIWAEILKSSYFAHCRKELFLSFVIFTMQNATFEHKIESSEICRAICSHTRLEELTCYEYDLVYNEFSENCISNNIPQIVKSDLKSIFLYQLDISPSFGVELMSNLIIKEKLDDLIYIYNLMKRNSDACFSQLWNSALQKVSLPSPSQSTTSIEDNIDESASAERDEEQDRLKVEQVVTFFSSWMTSLVRNCLLPENIATKEKYLSIIKEFLIFFYQNQESLGKLEATKTLFKEIQEIFENAPTREVDSSDFDYLLDSSELLTFVKNNTQTFMDFFRLLPNRDRETNSFPISEPLASYFIAKSMKNQRSSNEKGDTAHYYPLQKNISRRNRSLSL